MHCQIRTEFKGTNLIKKIDGDNRVIRILLPCVLNNPPTTCLSSLKTKKKLNLNFAADGLEYPVDQLRGRKLGLKTKILEV